MTETWATSGLDLHIEAGTTRVGASLEHALREAVRTGRLHPGTRLPSSRALARDLRLARNTVADAYGQLVAEGWLTSVQGSGTRVAGPGAPATDASPRPPSEDRRPAYDLRPGRPDVSAFPRAAWLRATRRALAGAPADAFDYGDPRGRPELRASLAGYLARARGVRASPDRVLVCSGYIQGLALLGRVLAGRGVTEVAVEAFGHRTHRDVVTAAGLAVTSLPVDGDGADTGRLRGEGAAVFTPAHQFPLGVPLAARRRGLAVEWAAGTGGVVVEDDYDGEFRYDRQAVGAMQALAPEHVAYAGTASKTLAPGLRLAWVVLPAALVDDMVSAKLLADRHGSTLEQLTLAQLIDAGDYDRQVRRARLAYRSRRGHLVAAVRAAAPRVRVAGVAAGLHALLDLPAGVTEADVVARGSAHGVALDGLGSFGPPGYRDRQALVVGFATPPAHAYTGAVARLCATLSEVCR